MGYTKTTFDITIQRLTQSGSGGYWWVERDSLGEVQNAGYNATGTKDSAGVLFGATNFKNLLAKMKVEGIALKDINNPIRIDDILIENNIESQIVNLTGPELDQIDLDWNTQVLVKRWGNPLLGMMFYRNGTFTWAGLKNRFKDMGYRRKLKRTRLVQILDFMVSNSDITTNQKDTFLAEWDADNDLV